MLPGTLYRKSDATTWSVARAWTMLSPLQEHIRKNRRKNLWGIAQMRILRERPPAAPSAKSVGLLICVTGKRFATSTRDTLCKEVCYHESINTVATPARLGETAA